MGFGLNIILFLFVIASVFAMMGYGNSTLYSLANATGISPDNGEINGGGAFWIQVLLLFGGAGLILGTVFFPNPYTLFAAIAVFLLALVPTIYDVIATSGLPQPIMTFFSLVFGGMFLMSVIVFLKGVEW